MGTTDIEDPAESLLIQAIEDGDDDLLRHCLESGDSPDAADTQGTPALVLATWRGDRLDCVRILLDAGADPNRCRDDGPGLTALMCAAMLMSEASKGNEHARALLDAGANVAVRDRNGQTALHHATTCAAYNNDPGTARLLLSRGASATLADNYGQTPLHILAGAIAERGDAGPDVCALLRELVRAGSDLDAADGRGRTPRNLLSPFLSAQEILDLLAAGGT